MHIVKRVFKFAFIISVVLLFLSQLFLLNDEIKSKLSVIYEMESQYVFSEQTIPKGTVVLEISNPSKDVYVLLNGEPICQFADKRCTVEVFDNCVIEIDGRNSDNDYRVKIVSVSNNVDGYYDNIQDVHKNISILGRFFIK